jgi:hypothetical protein
MENSNITDKIMTTEEIDDLVSDIMIEDGPDGHCDGHEIITEFILELLNGKGKDWALKYRNDKGID